MRNRSEFEKVVSQLVAQGVTNEDEQIEIIVRDYPHLLPEPDEGEITMTAAQAEILAANRESMKANGHPAFVCKRIDGEMKYKPYVSLSSEEIAQLKAEGVIL